MNYPVLFTSFLCACLSPVSLCGEATAPLPDVSEVTGAVIDESIIEVTLHVNPKEGSDANEGRSAESAFRSFRAGLRAARASVAEGVPTRLLLHPGTYREVVSSDFNTGKGRETLLVIEGTERGQVVFDGSDHFAADGWEYLGDGVYAHDWPHQFGFYFLNNANQILVSQRSEMIFVNNMPLRPVILEDHQYINDHSLPREERYEYKGFLDPAVTLEPGTFGVAEREENGRRLFLKLPSLVEMDEAVIEVGVRGRMVEIRNKDNLVLRNLVFRRAANLLREPPLQLSTVGHRTLIDVDTRSPAVIGSWQSTGGEWQRKNDDIDQPGHTGGQRVDSIPVWEGRSGGTTEIINGRFTAGKDVIYETRLRLTEQEGEAGLVFGTQESNGTSYHFVISAEEPAKALLYKVDGDRREKLDEAPFIREPGEYTWLTVYSVEGRLRCEANGKKLFTVMEEGAEGLSKIGLSVTNGKANFADITLKEWSQPLENILIENSDFRWNSSQGMSLWNMRQVTVRNSSFSYNGYQGINAGRLDNTLIEDCETNFNNWRGYWGGWIGRFVGAIKWHWTDNQIVRRHTSFGNLTYGFWYDIHCHNVVIEELYSVLNRGYGLFFEISEGPFLLDRSLLASNGRFSMHNAMVGSVTLRNSIFSSVDGLAPVDYFWYVRRDPHWAEEPLVASGYTVQGSVMYAPVANAVHHFRINVPQDDYRYAPASAAYIGASGNLYYGANKERGFRLHGGMSASGRDDVVSFATYLEATGETDSEWRDPLFTDPAGLDFTLQSRSPLRQRADTLPLKKMPDELIDSAELFFDWAGVAGMALPTRQKVRQVSMADTGGIGQRGVRMESPTPDAVIRYTVDGSAVTPRSSRYSGLVLVEPGTKIRARAFKRGLEESRETVLIIPVTDEEGIGELLAQEATYVRGGSYAEESYHHASSIQMKETNGRDYKREAYLLFDLATLPADAKKVTLRLFCQREEGGTNSLWLAPGRGERKSWEAALTWNRRPVGTQRIAEWDVPSGGGVVEIDITEEAKKARGQHLSLLLQGSYEAWTHYAGRDAGLRAPRLIVE